MIVYDKILIKKNEIHIIIKLHSLFTLQIYIYKKNKTTHLKKHLCFSNIIGLVHCTRFRGSVSGERVMFDIYHYHWRQIFLFIFSFIRKIQLIKISILLQEHCVVFHSNKLAVSYKHFYLFLKFCHVYRREKKVFNINAVIRWNGNQCI